MSNAGSREHYGPSNPLAAIFWISVLGLFLELLLIRWIGTEIRIFAYLQSTVLVVCFLGIGVGCFAARVRLVTDDARSFFATTDEKYDVISFGLLDSHTTTAMTNARLDHYVYTRESISHARDLLKDRGILCLAFAIQRGFIADRMAVLLRDVFGKVPVLVDLRQWRRSDWHFCFLGAASETTDA